MIPPETIAAIRAAYDAATPGEWYDIPHPEYRGSNHRIDNNPTADHANFGQIAYMSANNAALTCLAHNALPALLDAMEEARAVIQEQRACIKELVEAVGGYLLDESPGFAGRIKRLEDAIARAQRALDGKAGE